ncbi:bifunctional 3-oxoadipate enol-lactonase/4-carboxymuconolactone decarboxylase PcaDC [Methylovirgula sp. 4M-Z18]|uniref:bifunctional 3-oxoadipate enol-lactonase/4-carboxymuconolactone decarboxylase PcaDC n=1 Tax=Methylovirgula sp. 4M-Z18 TaxID=2293567 RepID=UPI000E2E7867|nr:alpha/beta fold hydrolase [Methylovirgula sp. 4M-Z18]RFB79451.1 alpha/beta fold hydrolase [Methylovirgula sp. 4M-Z18]
MPFLEIKGNRFRYELTGPEGAPVIAFSNSMGTTLEMWSEQVPALSKTFRVLCYDTRGHGQSQTIPGPATIDDLAEDLAQILTALEIDQAHIAGLSLGGMTAQVFAVNYPQRTLSLTLMATSAYLQANYDERARLVLEKGMEPIAKPVIERWFTPGFHRNHVDVVTDVLAHLRQIDPAGYASACQVIAQMDLRPRISAITAPTLIVAGADDQATPVEMMVDIQRRIAGAELIVLSPAAHLLALEQPAALNRHLLSFLERHQQIQEPDDQRFAVGLATRKSVLGDEHVERSFREASAFTKPWQEFITRTAWNDIWSDPTLPRKTRSLVTLAMMVALGREEEFALHIKPALKNGVSMEELRALLLQAAIYAGVPAANGAFKIANKILSDTASDI